MPIRRRQRGQRDGAVLELARRLGALLSELGLSEIEAAVGEIRVRLQRGGVSAPAPAPVAVERPAAPLPAEAESSSMVTIEAPMVGTFYRASSPTAEPYASEGDLVKEGQILCIIEAMKLMNEINAEIDGEVVKVYVENGHAVQYGERLFAIKPA